LGDKPEGLLPENCPNFLAGRKNFSFFFQGNLQDFYRTLTPLAQSWDVPLSKTREGLVLPENFSFFR
jgi:hypothetical protein